MPEIEWLQRLENGSKETETENIANMDRTDYAALLAETEHR